MPPKRKQHPQQPLLTSFFQKAKKSTTADGQSQAALTDTSNAQEQSSAQTVEETFRTPLAVDSSPIPSEHVETDTTTASSAVAAPPAAEEPLLWRTKATKIHIEQQERRRKRKLLRHANVYSSIWKRYQSISHNVVHGLLRRSLFVRTVAPPAPATYQLVDDEKVTNDRLRQPIPTQFAWDTQGMLLAVAMGKGRVCVYDRDDVVLRRDVAPLVAWSMAQCNAPTVVLQFGTDEQHEDELIVGVQAHKSLYIFDLRIVQGWIEDHRGTRPPPYRELSLDGVSIVESASVCSVESRLFLSSKTIVLAWNISSPWQPDVLTPLWKFNNHQVISSLWPSHDSALVCSTATGQFLVLDWSKVQRNSFGTNPRPTKIAEWTSRHSVLRILSHSSVPTPSAMCLTVHGRIVADYTTTASSPAATRFHVHAVGTNGYDWVWCGRNRPRAVTVAADVRVLAAAPTDVPEAFSVWVRTGRGHVASYPLPASISMVKSVTIDPERTCILVGTASHGMIVLRQCSLQPPVTCTLPDAV